MISFMKDVEAEYKIKVTFSIEDEPLGTAGPLALARDILMEDDEPFFMLNSDVACEFPLSQMLNFHKSHKREGTILVTPVEDPSKYGLVVANQSGMIEEFLEKPEKSANQNYPTNKINAGIYLLNKSVLSMLPSADKPVPVSIERQIFPAMAVKHDLYAMTLGGYWMDIGQPRDFLKGTKLHLASLAINAPADLATGPGITGNVIIHPSATVGSGCSIGPDVVVGPNVVLGDGVRVANATLMEGTRVGSHALVKDSIVGWGSNLRAWSQVRECFLGADVAVAAETVVYQAVVCPHKEVKESIFASQIVL
jgi:mannose-1-phosphate guanylyltransferase